MSDAPPRLVLDTNVCLDLFLFADPGCEALRLALEAGAVEAVCRADTHAEWRAVLAYPALRADAAARDAASLAFDRRVRRLAGPPAPPPPLPRCGDPDDQKFLELAAQAGARWLVSRDKALLALDRRLRRAGRFAVIAPREWSPAVPCAAAAG